LTCNGPASSESIWSVPRDGRFRAAHKTRRAWCTAQMTVPPSGESIHLSPPPTHTHTCGYSDTVTWMKLASDCLLEAFLLVHLLMPLPARCCPWCVWMFLFNPILSPYLPACPTHAMPPPFPLFLPLPCLTASILPDIPNLCVLPPPLPLPSSPHVQGA
jgi:hypothetical protein